MVIALQGSLLAQGIVYSVPGEPLYYGGLPSYQNINISSSGNTDFILYCDGVLGSFLYSQGNNSLVVVPLTGDLDNGSVVAALNQGDIVGPNPSSLDPTYVWHSAADDPTGSSGLADQNSAGQIGYFFSKTAYIGFDLVNGGQNYYGWMEVQNPLPIAAGSIVSWAYETSPNTPIVVGAVPEPSTNALVVLGGLCFWLIRRCCQKTGKT